MSNEGAITLYRCDHIGIAGTTAVFVQKIGDGRFEARVGIAILGSTNLTESELEHANPFDDSFRDNYAVGKGDTEEAALAALKADMKDTADSLWAM